MASAPTFSIVIPAYNAARTIHATIASLAAQDEQDYEVVVVDDGSTDDTAARATSAGGSRVRLVQQANAGLAAARNAGIEASVGRYVSFLDADDLWLPTYLGAMRAAFDTRPEAAMAYSDAWLWAESVQRFGRRTIMASVAPPQPPPADPRELLRELIERNFVYGSTTVRRSVLTEVGGFDARLRRSEDWELWLRLAASGHTFTVAAPVLSIYRIRAGSLSSDRQRMLDAEHAALEAVLEYDLDPEFEGEVRRRLEELERRPADSLATTDGAGSRERFTRHVPSGLRLRSYRLRRPPGVPRSLELLLRQSYGSS